MNYNKWRELEQKRTVSLEEAIAGLCAVGFLIASVSYIIHNKEKVEHYNIQPTQTNTFYHRGVSK